MEREGQNVLCSLPPCGGSIIPLVFYLQLATYAEMQEKKMANVSQDLVAEGATDDQEDAQVEGNTELTLEGVSNVDSEMDRVHIAEKNKVMAAKLKVKLVHDGDVVGLQSVYLQGLKVILQGLCWNDPGYKVMSRKPLNSKLIISAKKHVFIQW